MSVRSLRGPALSVAAAMALIIGASMSQSPGSATIGSSDLAAARTYTVNSTADRVDADLGTSRCADSHGKCTLRAAVMQANFHAGADTIKVPKGTFKLTRKGDDDMAILGDLDITDSLTIQGAGSSKTIIDGNGSVTLDRVFHVLPTAKVTVISSVTITHGRATDTFEQGAGVAWEGSGDDHLAIRHTVIEHNHGYYGGGIGISFPETYGFVDLDADTIRNNSAIAAGGGVSVGLADYADLRLRNSNVYGNSAFQGGGLSLGTGSHAIGASVRLSHDSIHNNHAAGHAGGLDNGSGTAGVPVLLVDSHVSANSTDGVGGAITNQGVLDVTQSTIDGNGAKLDGGGVYAFGGATTTLTNTTLTKNAATGRGGGIYSAKFSTYTTTTSLTNATMSGNAAATGGGIYADAGAEPALENTLLAKGSSGANCSAAFGGTTNLSDDASCGFGGGDSIADLMLSPLGDHGGRTQTHLPKAGSPALDAGTAANAPATDQRGIARPDGSAVDVGAVERCQTKPTAPALMSPKNKTTVKARKVTLDWNDVPCVQSYIVVVRHGSKAGSIVQIGRDVRASTFKTKTLHRGWTYYWEVKAVGDSGKTTSAWRHFHVKSS